LTPGFNADWKNHDPGRKFPPKMQPGSGGRHDGPSVPSLLGYIPQNPTPAPEISQLEHCF